MSWGGAIIGGIIGGIFGGPWGAAIGAAVGSSITGSKQQEEQQRSAPEPEERDTSLENWKALFRAFGKLAKSDGVVSREEADIVGAFLRQTELPSDSRKQLIAAFNAGKSDRRTFRALIIDVADRFYSKAYSNIMTALCDIVIADGKIDEREVAMLREAEQVLNQRGFVDRWLKNVRNDRRGDGEQRREAPPGSGPANDLSWAYQLLGLSPKCSDDDVRKAWRSKAKEYHPDLLRGKGIDESVIRLAEEQMRRVNAAYEAIKKVRGF